MKACTNNVNNSYIKNILNKRFCLGQNINPFKDNGEKTIFDL